MDWTVLGNYYFVCFAISIVLMVIYFAKRKDNYNIYMTLAYIVVVLTNFGYWQVAMSESTEAAILGNKVIYTGASFSALLIMLTVFDLCKVAIKKWLRLTLFLLSMLVYVFSLTVGYSKVFYKGVSLTKEKGITVMVKEYGPMHLLFYVLLIMYMLFGVLALIYVLRNKRDVSIKNTVLLLLCNLITLASFAIGRKLGIMDATPASTDIILVIYLIISDRFVLYNIDDTAISAMMKRGEVGVASFDLNRRFLGCNDAAREYYPVLGELRVDLSLGEYEGTNEIEEWIDTLEQKQEIRINYERKGKYYSVVGQYLKDGIKVRGLQFIIQDITEEKRYEMHLQTVAITDGLTGLLNRRAFNEEVEQIEENGIPDALVVASFDLNGLKKANDSQGHIAGDELLKGAAACLNGAFGEYGKVYRTGGDEFAVIAYCDTEQLECLQKSLQEKCSGCKSKFFDSISISGGYASKREFPEARLSALVKKADKRMYADKAEYYKRTGIDRREV